MPITETPTNTPRSRLRHGFRFALIGLIVGFLGLGIAAYRMSIESEPPILPKTKEISDVLSDTLKKTADKFRKKPPTPEPAPPAVVEWTVSKKLGLAAAICGFIAAAMGCISWLVREHRRWTWAALCVGIAALAWTHVVVAAAFAVGIGILIFFLSLT